MVPERLQQFPCCLCGEKGKKRLGVSVPVICIPIVNYPVPMYVQFKGALCHEHTAAFTLKTFAEHFIPDWYEYAGDQLRAVKKPAVNPYPDDPDFTWETFILNPNFEPAPKEQCKVKFWEPQCLAAKGAHQQL